MQRRNGRFRDDAANRLQRHFDRVTRRRGKLGAPQVALRGPGLEFQYGDQATPFHAASIGKLFTGAVVFQLAERGLLALDASVDRYLPASRLSGLFADGRMPTLLELLQHYSGAADFFEGQKGVRLIDEVTQNPGKVWVPQEMLDFARDRLRPVGLAGEKFHYSDTGFVLLGRTIEEVTGNPYHTEIAARIIGPLGLQRTFLPTLTLPVTGSADIAPCYINKENLSKTAALSCGWAGGGVAATPNDLLRFSEALQGGELISQESLGVMRAVRGKLRGGIHYGAAMTELRFEGFSPMLRGLPRPVGHLGSLATYLFANPATGMHLVMNFHARREMSRVVRSAIAVESVLK